MATFKIEQHKVLAGGECVCVYDDDGKFVATVVWREGHIGVISQHVDNVVIDRGMPPVVLVKLKPRR